MFWTIVFAVLVMLMAFPVVFLFVTFIYIILEGLVLNIRDLVTRRKNRDK